MQRRECAQIGTNDVARISRRESLKWFGMLLAGGALTPYPASAQVARREPGGPAAWPDLELPPVTAPGYGQDPDLLSLTKGPWPRTLDESELQSVRILADILVPAEGDVPSAAELQVEDVVDEWVSAPYTRQQQDRQQIVGLLHWLDDDAERRFDQPFADLDERQRLAIVDDIAWRDVADPFRTAAAAFDRLRSIVVAAFFCTPEGSADLGYMGNRVIAGDYPGPSVEAMRHLRGVLDELGLEEFKE